MKRLSLIALAVLFLPALALAQALTPPDPSDVFALVKFLFAAIDAHNYLLVIPTGVVLLIFALRNYGPRLFPKLAALNTDAGGMVLSLVSSFASAVLTAAAAPGAVSIPSILLVALLAFIAQEANFKALNKLINPSGADKAESIAKDAQAVEAKANAGGAQAAADAINNALKQ